MNKELEALDFLGKIYTKRNLQDFPIGNQPKQIVKMKVKNMPEFETIKKTLLRAKKVEELMLIYKQYYNGYLSPADQKRRQELEKELKEIKNE